MPAKVGHTLLQKFHDAPSDFSILDLFPVLDMREDKLVEVRGAFGYEVKLTKIDHVGRNRRASGHHGAGRKDSYNNGDRRGGRGPRKDSFGDKEPRARRDSKKEVKKEGRRKESTEEYYVKKGDKVDQPPKTDKPKAKRRNSKRKNSDDYEWAPKQVQGTVENKSDTQDSK